MLVNVSYRNQNLGYGRPQHAFQKTTARVQANTDDLLGGLEPPRLSACPMYPCSTPLALWS